MVINFIKIKTRKERALARAAVDVRGSRSVRSHGRKIAGVVGFCFHVMMEAELSSETLRVF